MSSNNPDTQPTVTEADREEAWGFRPDCYYENDYDRWMAGEYDDAAPIIRAFARHRSQETARSAELVDNRPDLVGDPVCKVASYNECHEDAVSLGYPSLTEALEHLSELKEARSADGGREPWPGCYADLQQRRVATLAKLGLMLSLMAGGEAAEVVGYDAAELYAEVLMALAIEDADDTDIALEELRDHPGCDIMTAQAKFSALTTPAADDGRHATGPWQKVCTFTPEPDAYYLVRGTMRLSVKQGSEIDADNEAAALISDHAPADDGGLRSALPRLDEGLIIAAMQGHYGKSAVNVDGVDLTVNGYNWSFREGFKRMWAGVRAELRARQALSSRGE
jgi:hypothetical protein